MRLRFPVTTDRGGRFGIDAQTACVNIEHLTSLSMGVGDGRLGLQALSARGWKPNFRWITPEREAEVLAAWKAR